MASRILNLPQWLDGFRTYTHACGSLLFVVLQREAENKFATVLRRQPTAYYRNHVVVIHWNLCCTLHRKPRFLLSIFEGSSDLNWLQALRVTGNRSSCIKSSKWVFCFALFFGKDLLLYRYVTIVMTRKPYWCMYRYVRDTTQPQVHRLKQNCCTCFAGRELHFYCTTLLRICVTSNTNRVFRFPKKTKNVLLGEVNAAVLWSMDG